MASGGWDGTARLWDAESGRELGALAGHGGNVTAVALHADGRQVATGVENGRILLWDARTRRREREMEGHAGEITGLAFTPGGPFLLSGSRDRTVRVWDLQRGETVRALPHPALALGLALTPVASVLLTACGDRCARPLALRLGARDGRHDGGSAPPENGAHRADERRDRAIALIGDMANI